MDWQPIDWTRVKWGFWSALGAVGMIAPSFTGKGNSMVGAALMLFGFAVLDILKRLPPNQGGE